MKTSHGAELHHVPFHAMGAPCQLRLYGGPEVEGAIESALGDIRRLESKYSRYLGESVTSQINASAGDHEGIEVDPETASLLDHAAVAHATSRGLFDVTSGVLRRAWDFASGRLPDDECLQELLPLVGWDEVSWTRPRLVLPRAGMQLDLGGLVKEYAVDRARVLCRENGVYHGLVDLGGDIAVVGPHPDGSPWEIGIRHPRHPRGAIATVELTDGAIASSGDYERFMIVDGERYGHILDPRTGWPARGLCAVSVLAPHCIVAGTASTIAMLQTESEARRWLRELGLPYLAIDPALRLGGTIATRETDAGRPDPLPATPRTARCRWGAP